MIEISFKEKQQQSLQAQEEPKSSKDSGSSENSLRRLNKLRAFKSCPKQKLKSVPDLATKQKQSSEVV